MSMPHNFSDDPNSYPGPPAKSSTTTVILVAIAVVCSTLMLICGGVIFGIVTTVQQAQREIEVVMGDQQWQMSSDQSAFEEYTECVAEGRYSEALQSLESGLSSDPESALLHNNKAWLLATCPDDNVRNGEIAIEHATKACDLTDWRNFAYVDTVAASYAEAGDFESAVKWQEEAIELADAAYLRDFQKRLRLFKAGKAYREGVPPMNDMTEETPTQEQPTESTVTDTLSDDLDEKPSTDEQP
ncbi:MAG TPA: hypothetical protein P5307_24375 [Pirellulaceae bacterium]|nr:hypothetical protein [Pirellulaceae bacterium]